ncbi:MAG: ABC transporter ATP-binding protein, partial [Betaproteobacteria bacterium]|nr:ABC transporter ATP-binding protein [Betaproteobacteria bacterium]
GTVIAVSHDRDFLDRVCTSVLMSEGQGRWVEYAGGYSDMLAQRGEGVTAAKAEKVEKKSAPKPVQAPVTPARPKISFKEQHELKQLNNDIAKMQTQMGKLDEILATPDLYTKDPKKFAQATAALAELHANLEKSEERWLELEMLKEG